MADPFDSTDSLAAATIVAAMVGNDYFAVKVTGSDMWDDIAKRWYECASALARHRQDRELKRR